MKNDRSSDNAACTDGNYLSDRSETVTVRRPDIRPLGSLNDHDDPLNPHELNGPVNRLNYGSENDADGCVFRYFAFTHLADDVDPSGSLGRDVVPAADDGLRNAWPRRKSDSTPPVHFQIASDDFAISSKLLTITCMKDRGSADLIALKGLKL